MERQAAGAKEWRLYSESQQPKKAAGLVSQAISLPQLGSGAFYPKRGEGKVLILAILQRRCVHFFLPAAIYMWAWSRGFL